MTATRTARWTGISGKEIEVRVQVTREMRQCAPTNADGVMVETTERELIESQSVVAYVDGTEVDRAYIGRIQHVRAKARADGLVIVGIVGSKVGLTAETLALVETALAEAAAEAETDPEVVAYRARQTESDKTESEYQAHAKRVDDMMTAGGRTY